MREKVGSAPLAESAPPVAGFYSPDLLKPRVIDEDASKTRSITPCPRCGSTRIGYFAGPTGKKVRCRACGLAVAR
jgi:hypothetical protein